MLIILLAVIPDNADQVTSKLVRDIQKAFFTMYLTRILWKASSHLLGKKSRKPQSERGY